MLKEVWTAFIEWLAIDIIAEHVARERSRSQDNVRILEEENRFHSTWFEHGQCKSCKERGLKEIRNNQPNGLPFLDSLIKVEDSLCMAICIIQNEAGGKLINGQLESEQRLRRWADELIEESGIDFDAVLERSTRDDVTLS